MRVHVSLIVPEGHMARSFDRIAKGADSCVTW